MNNFTWENLPPFSTYSGLMQSNLPEPQFCRSQTNSLPYHQTTPPGLDERTLNPTCISSNSATSDEAEDRQIRIIDERRRRRMISNRESARRSRMRKQRYLDELWSLVLRLRTENRNLLNKVNDLLENHDRVVQENAKLKAEALDLRQMLGDLRDISNSYPVLRDLEDVPCNAAYLRAESSCQYVSTPIDLLH